MVGDAWVSCVQLEITYNGIQLGKQRTPLTRAWVTTGAIGLLAEKFVEGVVKLHGMP